jgi:hypothetical protein
MALMSSLIMKTINRILMMRLINTKTQRSSKIKMNKQITLHSIRKKMMKRKKRIKGKRE